MKPLRDTPTEKMSTGALRNPYYSKAIDEVGAELYGSKYFTLVFAKSGYWLPIEFDEESFL